MTDDVRLPCSDAAVKEKTGRDWSGWCAVLDAKRATELSHRELAVLVGGLHDAGGWWSQTVAVGYERLRGKRTVGQQSGGTFAASTSKTLPVGADDAHAWFADAARRERWLTEPVVVRTSTPPKSLRLTWTDGTSVEIWVTDKGPAKASIAVQHSKLPDEGAVRDAKAFWKVALQRLAEAVPSDK